MSFDLVRQMDYFDMFIFQQMVFNLAELKMVFPLFVRFFEDVCAELLVLYSRKTILSHLQGLET